MYSAGREEGGGGLCTTVCCLLSVICCLLLSGSFEPANKLAYLSVRALTVGGGGGDSDSETVGLFCLLRQQCGCGE